MYRFNLSITKKIETANYSITNALNNPVITTALTAFGYDTTNLTDVQALLTTYENVTATQKTQTAEAQQATLDRDKAMKALDIWMRGFQEVSKIALEANPQLLEALRIAVKR